MEAMNILDFCVLNKIKTLPIKIDGKEYMDFKNYKKKSLWKNNTPTYRVDHFNTLSIEECNKITNQHLPETDYIGIDCADIQQLDIDDITGKYLDSPLADELKDYPHFLSIVKKMPHYFITTDYKQKKANIPWEHDVLYKGAWGWCHKDTIVYNAKQEIKPMSFNKVELQQPEEEQPEVLEEEEVLEVLEKKTYNKVELQQIIDCLPKEAYICGNNNYCFNMICALKKSGATRKQVKTLCEKAGDDYNDKWFKDAWLQKTAHLAFDIEFVLSKSSWSELERGVCHIIEDSYSADKEQKEKPEPLDMKAWRLFGEWAKNENLVRIKDSKIVAKIIKPYYAKPIYTDADETLNAFISSDVELEALFSGNNIKKLRPNIVSLLTNNQPNKDIPVVEYNLDYFGYEDGLYNIVENELITSDYPDGVLCRNYFDEKYKPLTETPEQFIKICKGQDWDDDTIETCLGVLGRSLYKINQLDDFGIVMTCYGVSKTGKSTFIEIIQKALNIQNVSTISTQGTQSNFGLFGKNKKEIIIISEAEELPKKIGLATFKSIVMGEMVETEGKNRDADEGIWTTPLLMASNAHIPYKDKSGGISNRIAYFKYPNIVKEDINVKKDLHKLIPQLIPLLVSKYLKMDREKEFVFTQQMTDWKDEIADQDNEFKEWINSMNDDVYTQLKYNTGSVIKPYDLQNAFNKHFKFTLNRKEPAPKIGINEIALLNKMGIIKKTVQYCKFCEKPHAKGCCDKYTRSDRKALITYTNCELISGGLNKYTDSTEFDCE